MIIITEYVYTADGVKLKTIHRTAVDGIEADGSSPELSEQNTHHKDSTLYVGAYEIGTGLKRCKYNFANGYVDISGAYVQSYNYFAKDHLGNVRHVDRSTPGRDNGIVQITNYYPFGGILNESFNRVDYQNKLYNGKEYDRMHGLNLYDYSARQYDPAIGQFTSMDPLCEKYYHISPYAYCAGNPVNGIDINGDSITILAGKETFVYSPGTTYEGKNEFIKKCCEILNNLNENGGNELLTELHQSDNVISFETGKRTGFKAKSPARAGLALLLKGKVNSIDSKRIGCGGQIFVNFNQDVSCPTEKGEESAPWYIIFGHELKHAANANKGMADNNPYDPKHVDPNLRQVTKDELSAMMYENYLRQKAVLPKGKHLPLRTAYSMYERELFFPVNP